MGSRDYLVRWLVNSARVMRRHPPMWVLQRSATMLLHGEFGSFAAALRRLGAARSGDGVGYRGWIERHETAKARQALEARLAAVHHPLISVVMPVYRPPPGLLAAAIESVRRQVYPNWELCLADDGSRDPAVAKLIEDAAAADPRIKFVLCPQNGGIAAATNAAFALASGEWVAAMDQDDILAPQALAEVAVTLDERPDAGIIYSDEDKLNAQGRRFGPYFKPDFSRELLRSQNYFNHLTVHRADNIRAVGGWRSDFDGSQDYDLNLRIFERVGAAHVVHIPKILYHWRAVAGSTATGAAQKGYATVAGLRALREHIARTGLKATVEMATGIDYYRVRPSLPAPPPRVSILIPTKDKVELLRSCVQSLLWRTDYADYEIIVIDNGSQEPEARRYLAKLEADRRFKVLRYGEAFNFSAINNFGVRHATGSVLALVNNDVEVISPEWLTEMTGWAIQDDVGCVGAKLYYANGNIQHAGVILGIGGVAGHSHKHFIGEEEGYFSRLKVVQNLSAVTAACLVVRRSIYEEVGGFNEELAIAFNDVDFCLKVREKGYVNVWTPYAELYHRESESRGAEDNPDKVRRFQREVSYMRSRWQLDRDPYYSPHLTREREDFSIGRSR